MCPSCKKDKKSHEMGVVIKDVEICYDCFLLRRKLSSLGGA